MSDHTSRTYQNILHISGVLYSFLTIFGAILVGKNEYISGTILMIIGAAMTRITSEVEFRKQTQLLKEIVKKGR